MTPTDALNILIESVAVAHKKGIYTLDESRDIANAIDVFTKKEDGKGTDTQNTEGSNS